MKCDHCGQPVRRIDHGAHVGGLRHDNEQGDLEGQFCETADGCVRVTVNGERNLDPPVRI